MLEDAFSGKGMEDGNFAPEGAASYAAKAKTRQLD